MYKGTNGKFCQTNGDFSVLLFLSDTWELRNASRAFSNATVANGATDTSVFAGVGTDIFGMAIHLAPSNGYDSPPSPDRTVRIRVSFKADGDATYTDYFDKNVPYASVCGFSVTDLPDAAYSIALDEGSVMVKVTNNTGVDINVSYITKGPLMLFNSNSGLIACNCGESLGNDEYLPQYGVSQMYGSFKVKETRTSKSFLSVLNDPESYNLYADLARFALRCEIYVGTQMAALMETDDFSFSNDGKEFEVTLKDVLQRLSSVYVNGPRVIDLGETHPLADVLQEFLVYEKTQQPSLLNLFDLSTIYQSTAFSSFKSGPIVLEGGTSLLDFLDKLGRATLTNIGVRHVITTGFLYGMFAYGSIYSHATPQGPLNLDVNVMKFFAQDIVGEIEYTPLKKNYVDKITYDSYNVGIEERARTYDIVYDLIDVNPLKNDSIDDDKAAFLTWWKAASRVAGWPQNNPLETTYGMRIPRPSDITYDGSTPVADYDGLERSGVRALTRGFLWRFSFAESFEGNPYAKANVSTLLATIANMAQYGGPSGGAFDKYYMLTAWGTAYSPADSTFDYVDWNGNSRTVHANNTTAAKMYYLRAIFQQMPAIYTLHYRIPSGAYFAKGASYTRKKYFSYWFTHVFGYNPWNAKDNWQYDERTWTPLGDSRSYGAYPVNEPVRWGDPLFQQAESDKISSYLTLRATANMKTAYYSAANPGYKAQRSGVFNTYDYGDPYVTAGGYLQVGMQHDIDGGGYVTGGFNVDDGVHSGEQVIWPALFYGVGGASNLPADKRPLYHSNFGGTEGDAAAVANADYVFVSSAILADNINQATIKVDIDGNCFLPDSLPTDSVLREAIRASEDNFLDKTLKESSDWVGTEDVGDPGQGIAGACNGYCTFWSVRGLSTLKDIEAQVKRSDDLSASFRWVNQRPSFGFCVKGVKYSIEGRFAVVARGETSVAQFNPSNRYDYRYDPSELVVGLTTNHGSGSIYNPALGRNLTEIASRFSDGATVYWVKSRIFGEHVAKTASAAGYVRNFYLNDYVREVTPVKNGTQTNILDEAYVVVRAIEYVLEDGETYMNLRLMR